MRSLRTARYTGRYAPVISLFGRDNFTSSAMRIRLSNTAHVPNSRRIPQSACASIIAAIRYSTLVRVQSLAHILLRAACLASSVCRGLDSRKGGGGIVGASGGVAQNPRRRTRRLIQPLSAGLLGVFWLRFRFSVCIDLGLRFGVDGLGVRWTEFHGFLSSLDLQPWQQSTHGDCHGLARLFFSTAAVLFWLVRLQPQK